MAEVYPNNYVDSLARERNRYRDALLKICNPDRCNWSAAEMFHIAEAALKGSDE